ncbi:TonB-dependent receptor [Algibacillus agarilyticus]|uniref:TonB-dependent receptor n=1 Tax=Algibacillus agarilyticus TaxID=2234133 RepID=UPI000DCF9575|nr:TonB-dependent receptor [Algibacillus agarilyticus]
MFNRKFSKTLLASSIASSLLISLSTTAVAADEAAVDEADGMEVIQIRGIRGSQVRSINNKRFATSVIDSISAEDIGKLPDATIADSLQRITGVQIRRTAGEGSSVNIRGMAQVLTQLNGESYMAAGAVTSIQPDFGDIPSQLFKGADVMKSTDASTLGGGITGVVNLQTLRPFDLEEGYTVTGAVESHYGADTQEVEPAFNLLAGWNSGKSGALLSVAFSDVTLGNYYNGMAGGGSDAGWSGMPTEAGAAGDNWNYNGTDVNGDGDLDDRFISYQGHTAYNRTTSRERLGVNLSFNHDFGEGLILTSDVFFTDLTEVEAAAGASISDKWQQWGWGKPGISRETGAEGISSTQQYIGTGRRLKSYSNIRVFEKESKNVNVELSYDNGSAFTFTARAIYGEAEDNNINSYADADMANGSQWGVEFQDYPEGNLATNPGGYAGLQTITVDYRGEHPHWSGVPTDVTSNINSYGIGALTSENNYDREGDMAILRFDGKYDLENSLVTSIESGARFSQRSASNTQYHLLGTFGPDNCKVRWKATDVDLNNDSCSWTNGDTTYTAGKPLALSSFGNAAIEISDFGPATGIPNLYALDPLAMQDVVGFHNTYYPGNVEGVIPGQSYNVDVDETSFYAQANFETDIANMPLTGNLGARYIKTDLSITQNIVGASLPYGAGQVDEGDSVTPRDYSDFLPALNLALAVNDEMLIRFAYSKTMSSLDLDQWGGGLAPTYAINSDTGVFEIISASSNGNPDLDPWRASNLDLSFEYYTGEASMFSLGLFKVDIDSFIERGSVDAELPDQDGVVRRTTSVQTNVQGEGGTLEGVEVALKQAFSDISVLKDGLLTNFGIEANYTYSPSDSGEKDLDGNKIPFIDNSENQYNLIAWYEADKLQARIAYNYRGERAAAFNQVWGTEGLTLYQDATAYVDASVSYDINENLTVYLNGSNLTGEFEEYYLQWNDQKAWQNVYEARYTVGVRGRL